MEIKSLDFGSCALLSTCGKLASPLDLKNPIWHPKWPPKLLTKWVKLQKLINNIPNVRKIGN